MCEILAGVTVFNHHRFISDEVHTDPVPVLRPHSHHQQKTHWLVVFPIPVLGSLHWLPVTFRIDFKVLLLVYKSLNGLGPKYITDMLTEYKPNRPLRLVGSSQLEIPRVHIKQGESDFSSYAAHSLNQLPEEIRCAKTLATFKSRLKSHLFRCELVE